MQATPIRLAANVQWAVDGNRHDMHTIPRVPDFPTVAVRVLKPFRFAPESVINGKLTTMAPVRTVEPGTILSDVIEPNV
jgi:hypothetical protein